MARQGTLLFDQRFMPKYAGALISDPAIAVVELIANAWDAYATHVEITWPDRVNGVPFRIIDNGCGMTPAAFERRWGTLDYDRRQEQGRFAESPPELSSRPARPAYGRNGRGRHAAFCFSSPYRVRTWRDGLEVTYEVALGRGESPFEWTLLGERRDVPGHGTEIAAIASDGVNLSAEEARAVVGSRFLIDPSFKVVIDQVEVTFDDIPTGLLQESEVEVGDLGTAKVMMIDVLRTDRTTRQHGIAWRVQNRLVGEAKWRSSDYELILDGRTAEARRFTFIVFADFLGDAVKSDWTDFDENSTDWRRTERAVQEHIRDRIAHYTRVRREQDKSTVKEKHAASLQRLAPSSRDRWNKFVDSAIDNCPSISVSDVDRLAGILANLESSSSKYALLSKLHEMAPGDLDNLHRILEDWTVSIARIALDEIQSRLRLIEELDVKLRDEHADEVRDLQPLFKSSLWIFGPEFESIEFTSNRGMTTVIRELFGSEERGSRNRPDFVILPEGSVGFYSRDAHGADHEVNGVASLVIVEIKRPGVVISTDEVGQPWRYYRELRQRGLVDEMTNVNCFVLGSQLDPTEAAPGVKGGVTITPLTYNVFIRRAERRMLNLREKLADAPFLKESGMDATAFIAMPEVRQGELLPGGSGRSYF